jgi:hypothetical protein
MEETSTSINPLDPAQYRLDPSYLNAGAAKKLLLNVPVRKPKRQEFFRVRPEPQHRLTPVAIIEIDEDRESYLVVPTLAAALNTECALVTLYTVITRQGTLIIWPAKIPGADGRKVNMWHLSAVEAAERAMKGWVKLSANMHSGFYEVSEALTHFEDPEWPDLSLSQVLEIAFKNRRIDSPDHPVLRKLRGEI